MIFEQIPRIDGGQDVILLSGGGNDVKLTDVLNQCVYQWAAVSKAHEKAARLLATQSKPIAIIVDSIDWDAITRGCEAQLDFSQTQIDFKLGDSLNSMIELAKKKLAPE